MNFNPYEPLASLIAKDELDDAKLCHLMRVAYAIGAMVYEWPHEEAVTGLDALAEVLEWMKTFQLEEAR